MTPERYAKIRQVLDRRQPDLRVLTDGVHKAQNLSAILRTCDAAGVMNLHMVTQPGQRTGIWKRSAGGSARWVKRHLHPDGSHATLALKQQGYRVYAANLSNKAVDYRTLDYTVPCVIVMGAEKTGVSAPVLALTDAEMTIPMMGMVESYNVSVATALILNEAQRQREQAGLYASPSRLSPTEYANTRFEWCHPKLARFCQKNNLAYPALDSEGDVLDPAQWYQDVRARKARNQPKELTDDHL
ncbi:tRNA (guanosine(18)-2'-O)-methyltransferase TrmH [Salinispirillum marinum]|uniref:tRNA (guanosine(18)-2'-O)-methyltransferase n=2 Tax=Saccharospirillaceae TaxID=255527 RepID=A0ABV8BHT3_9GAMM